MDSWRFFVADLNLRARRFAVWLIGPAEETLIEHNANDPSVPSRGSVGLTSSSDTEDSHSTTFDQLRRFFYTARRSRSHASDVVSRFRWSYVEDVRKSFESAGIDSPAQKTAPREPKMKVNTRIIADRSSYLSGPMHLPLAPLHLLTKPKLRNPETMHLKEDHRHRRSRLPNFGPLSTACEDDRARLCGNRRSNGLPNSSSLIGRHMWYYECLSSQIEMISNDCLIGMRADLDLHRCIDNVNNMCYDSERGELDRKCMGQGRLRIHECFNELRRVRAREYGLDERLNPKLPIILFVLVVLCFIFMIKLATSLPRRQQKQVDESEEPQTVEYRLL